jgi:hypothetical protein
VAKMTEEGRSCYFLGRKFIVVCSVGASRNYIPPMITCRRYQISSQLQMSSRVGALYYYFFSDLGEY